jgi:uncharacterized protein (TIGR00369 family)
MTSIPTTRPSPAWLPLDSDRGFQELVGPIFRDSSLTPGDPEPLRLGFRVAAKHCNSAGVCHGGMLATFMDQALGMSIAASIDAPPFTPTLNLSIDFIQAAYVDQWLESRVRIIHRTKGTGYCDCTVDGPQGLIARAHAVFRLSRTASSER